ncbi:MAG: FtsX-like permease family protein [Planctomycetes bacterium]|nr:FtsX-like permease family protein [Planctomycetota bacterium]
MTEFTQDPGEKLGPPSLHGDAMMLQLQQGWKPLPIATLMALALGGLRVRLTRSIVTMFSIVLAIAFLTYTGLSNQLTYRLVVRLEALEAVRPLPPRDVAAAALALSAAKPLEGVPIEQRLQLARDLGMDDDMALQSQSFTLPEVIRASKAKRDEAEKKFNETKADAKALRVDVEMAKSSLDDLNRQVQGQEEALKSVQEQMQLAQWVRSGQAGHADDLPARLERQIEDRFRATVGAMRNPGRLTPEGLKQLRDNLLTLPAVASLPETAKLREAVAVEYTKRDGGELRGLLVQSGVNIEEKQKSGGANAMDVWLIVMAMMTCAVGIANAMLMSVTERFREIGTMKCLGAQDNLVVKLFLLESGVLGVVGALIGIVLGVLVTLLGAVLQFKGHGIGNFPVRDGVVVILLSILGGVVLSVVGAVYPAYSASRMRPVDALRVDE